MITLTAYLHLIAARAQLLAPLVAMAYLVGSLFARGPFTALLATWDNAIRSLARKLDRKKRGVATLVYRGIVAVVMLLIPAIVVGTALSRPLPWVEVISAVLLFLWFGYCFATLPTIALWKQAKKEGLPLQIPELHYLFSDSHAVIRHLISTRLDAFAVGIVGGCFWYMIGGWMVLACYLTLASAAVAYRPHLAFGWAACGLFAVMDCIPRLISRILIALAAIFTPHANPFRGLFATNWRAFIADTLKISLSRSMEQEEIVWVGKGTARLTHQHLQRALYLVGAATLLLMLLLTSPIAITMLKNHTIMEKSTPLTKADGSL